MISFHEKTCPWSFNTICCEWFKSLSFDCETFFLNLGFGKCINMKLIVWSVAIRRDSGLSFRALELNTEIYNDNVRL